MDLAPGESVKLQGQVTTTAAELPSNIDLVPRTKDFLPNCISVTEPSVLSKDKQAKVSVLVKNISEKSVSINDQVILAELQFVNPVPDLDMEALVGPCAEAPVKINNVETTCLLDSGSQVTVISETFFKDLGTELFNLPNDISIIGAGGQEVEYIGVTYFNIELPKHVTGVAGSTDIYAFVCRDTSYLGTVPVVVGTNTFKALAKKYNTSKDSGGFSINCLSTFMYADSSPDCDEEGKMGPVKAQRKKVVPAGEAIDIWTYAKVKLPSTKSAVIVQGIDDLPEGLAVISQRIDAISTNIGHFKLTLMNSSNVDILEKFSFE